MKKTLVYGAATAAVVASLGGFSLAACRPDPESIEGLYGPPPFVEREDVDEPIEDVYGPPVELDELEETDAVQPALYGPPVAG